MASATPMRRLQQIIATVNASASSQLSLQVCAGIIDAEGEAAARFAAPKITVLEIGERGLTITKEKVIEKFRERSLECVFVHAVKDIPADTSVIVTTASPVGAEVLAMAPSLKMLAAARTGVDHIDLAACKSRGIVVSHVPDYSTNSTAELVVGLVLSHLKGIPRCSKIIAEGNWAAPPQEDLSTKTVGIVGVGSVGMRLAQLFKAFGVKGIRGYDLQFSKASAVVIESGTQDLSPALRAEVQFLSPVGYPGWKPKPTAQTDDPAFAMIGGLYLDSLAALFLDCDIVCICVPETEKTRGLISEKLLQLLRPNSMLVNVSRGAVVDEVALAKLLSQEKIRAALDVFTTEPLPQESPLRSVPEERLLMTPHIGYQSPASLEKRLDITLKNILAFLAGSPTNAVA